MPTLEVVLAVAGTVVAVVLFVLEVHGRRMENRSGRERAVIALLALILTALIAATIIHSRSASRVSSNTSVERQGEATTTPNATTVTSGALVNRAPGVETGTDVMSTGPIQPAQTASSSNVSQQVAHADTATSPDSANETTGDSQPDTRPAEHTNPQPVHHHAPTCSETNTGQYGFSNSVGDKTYTVNLDYGQESPATRTIMVPPGETQNFYDVSAGRHDFIVTYRAMVPIMTFPPGAPTMPGDVIYRRGEIYVEQCKTGILDIK